MPLTFLLRIEDDQYKNLLQELRKLNTNIKELVMTEQEAVEKLDSLNSIIQEISDDITFLKENSASVSEPIASRINSVGEKLVAAAAIFTKPEPETPPA